MTAASGRIARLKRIDRAAVGIITLGGVAVIVAVAGILFFIAAEALPLFRPARVTLEGAATIDTRAASADAPGFEAFGVDEYRKYLYTVEPDARVVFYRLDTGASVREVATASLAGTRVTATSRSLIGHLVAAATADGRVALLQVRFTPQYENQRLADLATEVLEHRVVLLDPAGRPIRLVSYAEQDGRTFVAGAVGPDAIALWWTDGDGEEHRATVTVAAPQIVTHVRIGRNGAVIAGTDRGRVYHWDLVPELRLTDVSPVSRSAVTALEWMLGGQSFVAGAADGSVSGWFRAAGAGGEPVMARTHTFASQSGAVVAIAMSSRERSFATLGRDGSLVLRHQTSERTLASLAVGAEVRGVLMTPKSNGLLTLGDRRLARFALSNPHPEVSWKTLLGKVWYEGYAAPEYVWQSTGATDDFEPKLSLVPLVFGTIKGTVYALLFAIPIAVLAALYTSQFAAPGIRAKVKPAVEIMAALPSVVIGFLAGLYLATVVERHLVAVLLMGALLPIAGTSGVLLRRLLPDAVGRRLKTGAEVLVIVPALVFAAWVAIQVGPSVELVLFGGDARGWLSQTLGITYDQRNSLVVGLAMGFAVIPIIFTISEDAFSSVPASLTAASLALGASRWQTAVRVVLPTASPGVFSAVMIGFGRAVGETMIVLMATGNTPVMDWSMFNGFRTLSANIAVEIPEAPQGGTLYRVLFLAAALLFLMTFAVNTVAEIIRQRLRERYRAI